MATCYLDVNLSFKDRKAFTWPVSGSYQWLRPKFHIKHYTYSICVLSFNLLFEWITVVYIFSIKSMVVVDCDQASRGSAAPFFQCANALTFTVIVMNPLWLWVTLQSHLSFRVLNVFPAKDPQTDGEMEPGPTTIYTLWNYVILNCMNLPCCCAFSAKRFK